MIKKKRLHRKKKFRETESRIVLTRRESLRLLELMENPPPMNEKLKLAMMRHSKLIETGTTHITPTGDNIILDLGFAPEEAASMLAETDQEIAANLARTTPYDVADHLRTPEEKAAYLEACIEISEGDPDFIKKAIADVARARCDLTTEQTE